MVVFRKTDGADPWDAANQDCIVPEVCLTRGDTGSLFNAVTESQAAGASPAGTRWAPEDCGQFHGNGRWSDNQCGNQYGCFCELQP